MAHGTLKDLNSTSGIIVKGERVVGLLAPGKGQGCVQSAALCLSLLSMQRCSQMCGGDQVTDNDKPRKVWAPRLCACCNQLHHTGQ